MVEIVDPETGEITEAAPARGRMPPEIAKAIVAVMGKVKQLGKDGKNTHQNYPYVSVDKFYEMVGAHMAEAGLFLIMDEDSAEIRDKWLWARYRLWLYHASGAEYGPIIRNIALPVGGPQAFGSGQSYIEKQFMRALFKIPTGDKDADETPESVPPEGKAGKPAPTKAPAKPNGATTPADDGRTEEERERAKTAFNTIRKKLGECIAQVEVRQVWDDHADDREFIARGWPKQHEALIAAFQKREQQIADGG